MSGEKASKTSFIKGLKAEYRKIVFPTPGEVVKHSFATVVVSFFIGALIAVLDLIIKTGLGFILK